MISKKFNDKISTENNIINSKKENYLFMKN